MGTNFLSAASAGPTGGQGGRAVAGATLVWGGTGQEGGQEFRFDHDQRNKSYRTVAGVRAGVIAPDLPDPSIPDAVHW